MRKKLVYDIEVSPDYFMVGFKRPDTGALRQYELFDGHPLDRATVLGIAQTYTLIGFNSINYDQYMMFAALRGMVAVEAGELSLPVLCRTLKDMSDRIIMTGLRPWQTEGAFNLEVPHWFDHIDLMETVPGVQIGLKLYGGRMHSKRLQELPYDHNDLVKPNDPFSERRKNILAYNDNDLQTTIDLWNTATNPKNNIIATRELLSAEFGVDVRSKSDAQIAETIIKQQVIKRTGRPLYKNEVVPGTAFQYQPPAFLKFQTPVMQETFAAVCNASFVVAQSGSVELPAALDGRDIRIGKSVYRMGIGGLHSSEKSVAHIASDKVLLRDRDVNSFYPALILQCGLFPLNMGFHFQQIYKSFFDRRIAAKKAGHDSTALTLKIFLNGTFGKLGSKYSVLYAPNLLIQVTVTGQLVLLMMIERMELAGIPVVSANTDGIVMACPAHLEPTMLSIVKQWEIETGLETEETQYSALYSRDVNNYLAVKTNGKVKTKGTLSDPGVMKNPANTIVNKAVVDLLVNQKPVAETVLGCNDVREFLRVQRVTGGAQLPVARRWRDDWIRGEDHWYLETSNKVLKEKRKSKPAPVLVTEDANYLGKTVRWYVSRNGVDCIEYVKNGNKVPNSDRAMPCMELPDQLPDDIDYGYYIAEANDLLREIGAMRG